MKVLIGCAALLVVTGFAASAQKPPTLNLIPWPVSVEQQPGSFRLRPGLTIAVTPDAPETRQVAEYLSTVLNLKVAATAKAPIVLAIDSKPGRFPNSEGYELRVTARGVRIEASSAAGLFYGVQTLLQLLPPEIEGKAPHAASWTVPCVHITDYPRFAWRGLLLDVARHFFDKAAVEQYIDRMARYKLNVFHWHLTDDNGWRVQINSLPDLTKVGAWRVPRLGKWGKREPPRDGEAATDGGFYTQDDIREVLAYAKQRFVTVIPEIEMPGHSLAAIASYPEISCAGRPAHVDPGSDIWGQHDAVDNALCPGNEKTFEYIDKVFTEVSALFPSPYVHIGGDECSKVFWKTCPKCQKRMAEEHLKTPEELQSYLVRRAEKILESKGKRLVGWDEILEGGLAPNATVMSWRGMEGGIAAAKMQHQVIMTPVDFAYLDYYQGDPTTEPSTFGRLLLSTCYRFEPVPEGVDAKYILGGQANLWTESVPQLRHAEYMTWPRTFALSEVFWSPKAPRDWDGFFHRVEGQFERLDAAQVNYSRAVYDVAVTPALDAGGKLSLTMSTELSGCEIYYTFDGTNPDPFASKYAGSSVPVPGDAYIVRAIAWRNGHPSGRLLSVTTDELKTRIEK